MPNDEGVALAAVIGLMAVLLVVSVAVTSATLNATSVATSTRADVQSQAAADAGVDAAYASIAAAVKGGAAPPCTVPASTTTPIYSVTIKYNGATTACTGSTFTGTPATAVVVSDGSASSAALRATDGNQARVVGNVKFSTTTTAGVATGTGPAVYSYIFGSFSGSGSVRSYTDPTTGITSVPDVMVKVGDVACTGGAVAQTSDLVVENGALSVSGSCTVGRDVYSSGALTVSGGGVVGGNATASSISAISGGKINGDVSTPGLLTATGTGKVGLTTADTASVGSAYLASGTVAGSLWSTGSTSLSQSAIGKNLTTKTLSNVGSTIGGTTTITATPGTSPYVIPTAPSVPQWLDYSYTPSTWSGYQVVTLPVGVCGYTQINAALTTLGTNNGVIDARNCIGAVDPGYQTLTLHSNVAIIANAFSLGSSAGFDSVGVQNLWLVTPDLLAGNVPTCSLGQFFSIGGAFTFSSSIHTFIYTPCAVNVTAGTSIYGQIWAGSVAWSGAGTMYFSPVGLPGYDLAVGSAVTSTTSTSATLASRYDSAG